MKILFVVTSMGIGGEQKVITLLANQFSKLGNEVSIQTIIKSNIEFELEPSVKILNSVNAKEHSKYKNIARLFKLRKIIKILKPDIVIAFNIISSILCCIAGIGIAKTMICERNLPGIYPVIYKIMRRLSYTFASGAVFQTIDARLYFNNWLKCKTIIIENPLDIKKLPNKSKDIKKKEIVSGGRLMPQKNFELLINSFADIHKIYQEYNLIIYGNGPMWEKLKLLIKEKNLDKKVFLKHAVPDFPDKIKDSEIFVLPSNREGFPNVLIEAMAIGLAVISTDCPAGGPRAIINNSENGLLVNVGDLKGMIEALKLYLENPSLRNKCAKNAYKIRKRLSIDIIAEKWLDFISTI